MKKIITLAILTLLTFNCTNKTIKKNKNIPYALKGETAEPLNGAIIKLIYYKDKIKIISDIDTIKNNTFLLKGTASINHTFLQFENSKDSFPILLNKKMIQIKMTSKNLKNALFFDNKIQQDYISYHTQLKEKDSTQQLKFDFLNSYIRKNSNSPILPVLFEEFKKDTSITFLQFTTLYNATDSVHKVNNLAINNYIEKEKIATKKKHIADSITKVKIALEKKRRAIPIRSKASPFSAESTNGSYIALDDLIAKNKVIIIDFWASWCGPCRTANPSLVRLYKKYHTKGLEIISISEDKDKNAWKAAIAADNLTWPQVIDENGRLTFMYSVRSIPHAFVLDKNGGIAGYDIHTGGSKIEKLIIQLMNE